MEIRLTTFTLALFIPLLLAGCYSPYGSYSYGSIRYEHIQHEEAGLVPGAVRYANQDAYFKRYYNYYNRYHYYNYPTSYYRTSFYSKRPYSTFYRGYRRSYFDAYPGFYFNLGYTPRDYYYNPGFVSQTYYYRGSY